MEDHDIISQLEQMRNPVADKQAEGTPDQADFWWRLVHLDPAILRGAVMSVIALVATFGLIVGDAKQAAIITAIGSILALVQALWTRKAVTPNAKVVVYKPDPIKAPDLVVPGPAVSSDVVAVANAAADTVHEDRQVQELPFPGKVDQ